MTGTLRTSRRSGGAMGARDRGRLAQLGRLGGDRARQPPVGFSLERRRGDLPPRRHRRAQWLLGFPCHCSRLSLGRELLPAAASAACVVFRSSTGAGYACFVGGAPAAQTRTAPPNWKRSRAMRRASPDTPHHRGAVRSIAATSIATSSSRCGSRLPGPSRAYGIAAYVDGLQSAGRVDEASNHRRRDRGCARAGNAY